MAAETGNANIFGTMTDRINDSRHDLKFLPRDALAHSAVLRLHVVRPSVCNVGGSGSHILEILETNCTIN